MIYVTHDQIEAMTLADRIAVMKNGVIQQLDSPKQIYNKPANLFVADFIGSPGMNFFNGKYNKEENSFHFITQISVSRIMNLKINLKIQAVLF